MYSSYLSCQIKIATKVQTTRIYTCIIIHLSFGTIHLIQTVTNLRGESEKQGLSVYKLRSTLTFFALTPQYKLFSVA